MTRLSQKESPESEEHRGLVGGRIVGGMRTKAQGASGKMTVFHDMELPHNYRGGGMLDGLKIPLRIPAK